MDGNFMDRDFLLDTPLARELYHGYAKGSPIYDFHNHLSPADIARRRRFADLAELWLEGDHYKWRAMRACGVDEAYITGSAEPYEKFMAWAKTVPLLVGCPLYHWTHLELQRYFGISTPLTPESAPGIWQQTRVMLASPGFDAAGLLAMQNVRVACTTDDPADTLVHHSAIRERGDLPFSVLPSFRPDKYLDAAAPGFAAAVERLGRAEGMEITGFDGLKAALSHSLERFAALGCRVSDHGLSVFRFARGEAAPVFEKALDGKAVSADELAAYQGELLMFLAGEYCRLGIAMQLHLGPVRNASPRLYALIGPDAGGDSTGKCVDPYVLAAFLGALEGEGRLPNTVIYSINAADNGVVSTLAASFAPKVQMGAAWWFNDTIRGMTAQIYELMETGQLAKSVGMLTDSRSFTSFPRHEYYRRLLCNIFAEQRYPRDVGTLGAIVRAVTHENARVFFRLP